MEAIFCGGTWESQKEVCFVQMTRVSCDDFFSMRWHDVLDPRFSWGSLCSHSEWTCWVPRWHFLHILEQGDCALARCLCAIDVCWISGSWISKDYEANFSETQRFNEFFQRFFCSFDMVCIKWIKCVFLPRVAFYRVWVSQRVWVDIPVKEGLMVGHWLFHFEGAGLMCTSPLGIHSHWKARCSDTG